MHPNGMPARIALQIRRSHHSLASLQDAFLSERIPVVSLALNHRIGKSLRCLRHPIREFN
jgi:hypothetical protein